MTAPPQTMEVRTVLEDIASSVVSQGITPAVSSPVVRSQSGSQNQMSLLSLDAAVKFVHALGVDSHGLDLRKARIKEIMIGGKSHFVVEYDGHTVDIVPPSLALNAQIVYGPSATYPHKIQSPPQDVTEAVLRYYK